MSPSTTSLLVSIVPTLALRSMTSRSSCFFCSAVISTKSTYFPRTLGLGTRFAMSDQASLVQLVRQDKLALSTSSELVLQRDERGASSKRSDPLQRREVVVRRERVVLEPGRSQPNPPREGVQLVEVRVVRCQVARAEPEWAPRVGVHAKLVDHDHREEIRAFRRIFRRSRSDMFATAAKVKPWQFKGGQKQPKTFERSSRRARSIKSS
jgi:hypothetical protein